MDELEDFNNPGIFEGAAGFDGIGADAAPDTVSAPPSAPPIDPVAPVQPPPPPSAGQPATPPVQVQPPQPVMPNGGMSFDWWTALDVAAGAAVGYVSAKDPKDRARNAAICAAAAGIGGSLGLGIACWWIVSQRGR